MVIRLEIESWVIGKDSTKRRSEKEGMGKMYGGFWVLWSLYVFRYISVVVVEGACVRDFRGICAECVRGHSSVVTVGGMIRGDGEDEGESG
jgi:hypothetical protein